MLRATPHRIEALEGKRVTQIACGRDFVVTLGLTKPISELEKSGRRNGTTGRKKPSGTNREGSGSRGRSLGTINRTDYESATSGR